MKKTICFIIIFFTFLICKAQQNVQYHLYQLEEKTGIVDSQNNIVLEAVYNANTQHLKSKQLWILKKGEQSTTFNYNNGSKHVYKQYSPYALYHKDTSYAKVQDGEKHYFLNHYNDNIYEIKHPDLKFYSIHHYFYTSEVNIVNDPISKNKKTELHPPPKATTTNTLYSFYYSPSDSKPFIAIAATDMIPLSKPYSNHNYEIEFLAFIDGKTVKVYDKNFKLYKTLNNYDNNIRQIENEISQLSNLNLRYNGPVPSISGRNISYPILSTRKQEDETVVYAIYDEYNLSKDLFTYKGKAEVNNNIVTIYKNDKKHASFDVDIYSGKIFLPKAILNSLPFNLQNKVNNNQKIYTQVDKEAVFPGGDNEYYKYIQSNLDIPKSVKKEKLYGKVNLKFVIEQDGSISNLSIIKSINEDHDNEIKKLFNKMPKWEPAKVKNIPVRSYKTLILNVDAR